MASAAGTSKFVKKIKAMAIVTSTATIFFGAINIYKGNEKFYENVVMPTIRLLPPETAHKLGVMACKYKVLNNQHNTDFENLKTKFFGKIISNPLGIAAGFDKQGEAVEGLHQMGFGFVEIGSVTPLPQPGNPKPRVFRLVEDRAIINRYGFNSDGHEKVYKRIRKLRFYDNFSGVLGINLGKNKTSENANLDYTKGIELFGPLADYLVINISSPNTPGLRNLQHKKDLENLLVNVITARDALPFPVPIFIKIAPDLTNQEVKDIVDVIGKKHCKVDGLIICNTTIDKSNLYNAIHKNEIGGVSGAPLRSKSTEMIAKVYKETGGKIPIIGVGGIFNGQDAFEKIQAGASFLQIYTALIYFGPPVVNRIKYELHEILQKNGYQNVNDAVGKNFKQYIR